MKEYIAENERIQNEWRDRYVANVSPKRPENTKEEIAKEFAFDGIMNIGDNYNIDEKGRIWRKACGKENILWKECPLRVLFMTKDENNEDNEAWDIRTETFYKIGNGLPPNNKTISDSFFFQNEACILYGLLNTTPEKMIMFDDFSWEDALNNSDNNIFARINCKKEKGGPIILNKTLNDSIKEYFDYLKEQILNIDADILVCCGNQNDNNLILNAVYNIYNNEFNYVNCVDGKGTGMHYNEKQNKLAIDAYHLAYFKGGLEARYNESVEMYYEFLKYLKKTKGIDFSSSHRNE